MPIDEAGSPIAAPAAGATGGGPISSHGPPTGGEPVAGGESLFNRGGAPIAVLGGVFSGGLPIGGPVTQIFRGGSGPQPPTLFFATISPGGPIGSFFVGSAGGPIGVDVFLGGGLPISSPPSVQQEEAQEQARTALVALASTETIFEGGTTSSGGAPITSQASAPLSGIAGEFN